MPASVGKILENYQTIIDSHNTKYNLGKYDNRKKGKDVCNQIQIEKLVTNGINLDLKLKKA